MEARTIMDALDSHTFITLCPYQHGRWGRSKTVRCGLPTESSKYMHAPQLGLEVGTLALAGFAAGAQGMTIHLSSTALVPPHEHKSARFASQIRHQLYSSLGDGLARAEALWTPRDLAQRFPVMRMLVGAAILGGLGLLVDPFASTAALTVPATENHFWRRRHAGTLPPDHFCALVIDDVPLLVVYRAPRTQAPGATPHVIYSNICKNPDHPGFSGVRYWRSFAATIPGLDHGDSFDLENFSTAIAHYVPALSGILVPTVAARTATG